MQLYGQLGCKSPGASGDKKTDWALFWIKCYSGKNKEKQKKVYLAEYEKKYSAWMKRRLKLMKSKNFPYMMTGVVGGHSADDPPTVYLYEGYQSAPSIFIAIRYCSKQV